MKKAYFLRGGLLLLLLLSFACARTTVVLLPDEDGQMGEVLVKNTDESKEQLLNSDNQIVEVGDKGAFSSVKSIDPKKMEKRFGQAIAALPEVQEKFFIYFGKDSYIPKDSPKTFLPAILKRIEERKLVDVYVLGHTDRSGKPWVNELFSRKRAEHVANLLRKSGVSPEIIKIQFFGPNLPLVPYAKGRKSEPKNRRVEVVLQ